MTKYIGAIDQGTTSTRFILFDRRGDIVALDSREHRQIYPLPGWVEHDAAEIWRNTQLVMDGALAKASLSKSDVAAIGVTNQRETTVLWSRATGEPLHNAIVWMDTRTDRARGAFRGKRREGTPARADRPAAGVLFFRPQARVVASTFAAVARKGAEMARRCLAQSIPGSIWNLTGGVNGGRHVTDATNASRTQLMNLETLQWDDSILRLFDIPRACLPEIRSSSEIYGSCAGRFSGVAISGALGDQHGALLGQACLHPGDAKNTYGTGCFLLMNTGDKPHFSEHGLITTLAYKLGDAPPVYALEGSIAIAGALVQWLRDNLGIIQSSKDIEALAAERSRQWRRLFRAGFFRALRAALARRRARRDRGSHALFHKGSYRARGVGSRRLSDARSARRDGCGLQASRSPNCASTAAWPRMGF